MSTENLHEDDPYPSNDAYARVIHEMAHALFVGFLNEMGMDQRCLDSGLPTHDDPVKFRLGAFRPGRDGFYLGAISMDQLKWEDGKVIRHEKGFIAFKMDPHPCMDFYLQRTKDTVEDRDMVHVARLSAAGIELKVPVKGIGTLDSGAGPSSFLRSPNGRYEMEIQDDGNVVVYDELNGHRAVSAFPIGSGV